MTAFLRILHDIIGFIANVFGIASFFGFSASVLAAGASTWIGIRWGVPFAEILVVALILAAFLLYLSTLRIFRFGRMPLARAAAIGYRRLQDTLWPEAVSRFAPTDTGLLDYIGTGIAAEIPVFGRRSSLAKLEKISDQLPQGQIVNGASAFKRHGEQEVRYVQLAINRRDLDEAIRRMKGN